MVIRNLWIRLKTKVIKIEKRPNRLQNEEIGPTTLKKVKGVEIFENRTFLDGFAH